MKKTYFLILIIILLLSLFISYNVLINDLPKDIRNIFEYKYTKKLDLKIDFLSLIVKNYHKSNFIIKDNNQVLMNEFNPIVYIYNTHTNEEYKEIDNNLFNVKPTIKTASNILKEELSKYNIDSVIENENVTNYINNNNLPYSDSYKISRMYLENKKIEYPSLIYFIDLHRDSVKRDITTININNINYARVMFLLGLENEKYELNKKVMLSLNNYLELNYKGLSRGIYEKKGKGVNGVYNQDFDSNVILIEVGGVDNTIDEVNNSIKVIAECLANYINSNKTTKLE